tara:strand:- start:127 stop:261 length:135 start_codon:yes stop_codon:yes gene_type:complete
VDRLSVEYLEAVLAEKKTKVFPDYKLKPMIEEQHPKEHCNHKII